MGSSSKCRFGSAVSVSYRPVEAAHLLLSKPPSSRLLGALNYEMSFAEHARCLFVRARQIPSEVPISEHFLTGSDGAA